MSDNTDTDTTTQEATAAPAAPAISQEFAERIVKHYGRRVHNDGERPTLVVDDLIDGAFRADVSKKSRHMVMTIGARPALTSDDAANDLATHAAMQKAATSFGVTLRDIRKQKQAKKEAAKKATPPSPAPTHAPAPAPQPAAPQPAAPKPAKPATVTPTPSAAQPDDDTADEGGEVAVVGVIESDEPADGGEGSGRNEHEKRAGDKEEAETDDLDLEEQKKEFKDMPDFELPEEEQSEMARDTQRSGYNGFDFASTNGLMRALKAELASVAQCVKYPHRMSGELDIEEKCADIASSTGLDRIFYNQTDGRQLNAVVQILIDTSGSTGGAILQTEAGLAHVMAECLERMRVPCQVISFQGPAYLVKDFPERVSDQNIPQLCSGGSTNLPRAMTIGARELAKRREKRKVQLVMTDGDTGWLPNAELAERQRTINEYCVRTQMTAAASARHMQDTAAMADISHLQRICPGLETLAFGIGVGVKAGIFDLAISNLTAANMVEVVAQSLGRALTAPMR